MKITEKNLSKMKYVEKSKKWYLGNTAYIKIDACKVCNEPYLTRAYKSGDFCSYKCMGEFNIKKLIGRRFGRLTVIEDSGKRKRRNVIWKCKCDCGNIKEVSNGHLGRNVFSCGCLGKELRKLRSKENSPSWKGGVTKKNLPFYDTYAEQIMYAEPVRRSTEDKNILEVKCTYCGKWYIPKMSDINNRIQALNGNVNSDAENRLYCSYGCKKECPIFWRVKHPKGYKKTSSREVQPELRQIVFERDDWTCQKCDSTKSLHCHHVEGIRWEPLESADIDKCITYCKKCHKEVHKKEECKYKDMICK